jgi:hypothetical protein
MENLKIRIPCEEVSKLVQEKAFEMGYGWRGYNDTGVSHASSPYLIFYNHGKITYYDTTSSSFGRHSNKEISWQEFVWGEGYFFTHVYGDKLYYQARSNNKVYWLHQGKVEVSTHFTWQKYLGTAWYETDMFGNKLEEKIMNKEFSKDDLKTGMVVEWESKIGDVVTNEMCVVLRDTEHGDVLAGSSWKPLYSLDMDSVLKVWQPLSNMAYSMTTRYSAGEGDTYDWSKYNLNNKDNFKVVYEKDTTIEMTMEEICLALGKSVKIIKGE